MKWKSKGRKKCNIEISVLLFLLVFLFVIARNARLQALEEAYYASSSFSVKIDNEKNVLNYPYHATKRRVDVKNVLLKDLDFSFCEKIDIPGMPRTKESDFLNQTIFSKAQCPQGLCITEDFVLITSYSSEDDCMGELMVMDRITGEYLMTLGMDEDSHLGGIAFDGLNVWVCNSHENCIERISYDFIAQMAMKNKGQVIDARDVVDRYPVSNTPSCITYYGGRLWIATHSPLFRSKMVAYHFDSTTDSLNSLSSYNIPATVQGVVFEEDGGVCLSLSYGRSESSFLYYYDSVVSMTTKPKKPELAVEMPPCSEEIEIYGDQLYVLFESAGEKYMEGTDGKGQSLSPIDKLLMIPLTEIIP